MRLATDNSEHIQNYGDNIEALKQLAEACKHKSNKHQHIDFKGTPASPSCHACLPFFPPMALGPWGLLTFLGEAQMGLAQKGSQLFENGVSHR